MLGIALLLAAALTGADPKTELAQYRADARAANDALTKSDFTTAEKALHSALAHAPQRPAILYNLASAEAKHGENASALALLRRYADMGIVNGNEADADFPTLTATRGYLSAKAQMAHAAQPICACQVFFTGPAEPFIAEGIARDENRIFVAGVHARRIVAIVDGHVSDFVPQLPEHYSPFGMAVDHAHNRLWVTAAVIMQSAGSAAAEQGRSALLAFDLATGALAKTYPAPSDRKLALGDIALAPDGSVYVSDSLEGSLFVLKPDADALSDVGAPAMLSSAQGMAVSANGKQLLVADYAMGLLRVDLATGKLAAIAIPANVTTIGIDGLARLSDGSFVATQNGFKSARVLRLRLSADWSALRVLDVVAANTDDVSDPSLVATDGRDAYVVGVAQWASFDDDKADSVRPVVPWKIIRVAIP